MADFNDFDDPTDDDEPLSWQPGRAETSRVAKRRGVIEIDDSDDSSDDDDDVWGWSNHGRKRQKTTTLAEGIDSLSGCKKEKLEKIKEPLDKCLQALLWQINCSYDLYEHQFEGVRVLAGVPADFPQKKSMPTHEILRIVEPRLQNDRGIIMADVMGLGKTVVGVAACILRNAIADAKRKSKKPTLICSPNDAVLKQWKTTLIKAGVDATKVYRFRTKRERPLKGDIFVLCNIYDLQTEVRFIFDSLTKAQTGVPIPKSPLFPNCRNRLLRILKNQYRANKGKEKNQYNMVMGEPITICECITHYLKREAANLSWKEAIFQTVIIDEAHFLKNLMTFWGMAAALLGLHTERMIPMTGTPYNNSCQDLASLTAFIAPAHPSANEKWWKSVTEQGAARRVVRALSGWRSTYLLRRGKDVIAKSLPKKIVRINRLAAYPLELTVYEKEEAKYLSVLKQLHKLKYCEKGTPLQRKQEDDCFRKMMGLAACMRMALIHPVLPRGGREVTALFSPSRCKMKSVLKGQEKKNQCVCCKRTVNLKVREKKNTLLGALNSFADPNLMDADADIFSGEDDLFIEDDEEEAEEDFQTRRGTGEIVPIPSVFCQLREKGIRHFACESCLAKLEEEAQSCPRCADLFSRLQCESGVHELKEKRPELFLNDDSGRMHLPGKLYCQDTFGGFRASSKLESIVSHVSTLPEDDKVLIASFFKGSLDLLEAMFYEANVEVARFDGDVESDEREEELERFKLKRSCRVLLVTVKTAGVGLNLMAANHVCFVDRGWNPMVMEQCEDRCYRLGQKKDVHVVYNDVSSTIDDAMRHINEVKLTNAGVLLDDLLNTVGVVFKDIAGFLGSALHTLREKRSNHIEQNPQNIMTPLPLGNTGLLDSIRASSMRSSRQIPSMVDAIPAMWGSALSQDAQNSARVRSVRRAPSLVDTFTTLQCYDSPIPRALFRNPRISSRVDSPPTPHQDNSRSIASTVTGTNDDDDIISIHSSSDGDSSVEVIELDSNDGTVSQHASPNEMDPNGDDERFNPATTGRADSWSLANYYVAGTNSDDEVACIVM